MKPFISKAASMLAVAAFSAIPLAAAVVAEWNASIGLVGDGPYRDHTFWRAAQGTVDAVLADKVEDPGMDLICVTATGPGGVKLNGISSALRKPRPVPATQLGPSFPMFPATASGSFTLEMWIKPGWKSAPATHTLLFEAGGQNRGFSVTQQKGTDLIRLALGGREGGRGTVDATLPAEFYDGHLHQLVFAYDKPGSSGAIYFDGRLLASVASLGPGIDWQGKEMGGILGAAGICAAKGIGFDCPGSKGDIGRVCIHDEALTAAKVAEIFRLAMGR